MSKKNFNSSTEPARGYQSFVQQDAPTNPATAVKRALGDRHQHIATLQDEFKALVLTNNQYVQTLQDRDKTISSLQDGIQDHEIVNAALIDQLRDVKALEDQHERDHKEIVVLEAGLANIKSKYDKELEENHTLSHNLEKSENALAELGFDREQTGKWRSECDAARRHVKENKEFKTVNTELRALLEAATAEQFGDKRQQRIVELMRIKHMYEREIKELRSTIESSQAATSRATQIEARE